MNYKYEYWTKTAGDLSQKRMPINTPLEHSKAGDGYQIIIDPTLKKTKLDWRWSRFD